MCYKRGCSLVVVRCLLFVVGCVWVANAFHVWWVGVLLVMLLAVGCFFIILFLFVRVWFVAVFVCVCVCDGVLLVGCVRFCLLLFVVCCYLLIDG